MYNVLKHICVCVWGQKTLQRIPGESDQRSHPGPSSPLRQSGAESCLREIPGDAAESGQRGR